ncbi:MAG: IPT/TIG domain-containing protein [Dehalococcoidia bacterium]|nr:IPT/TIG domain-containing protein [Dehalococcoidia bacterium]
MHQSTGFLNRPLLGLVVVVSAVMALLSVTSVFAAVPVVGTVSPASGPTGGGNTVTISGTGFTGVTAVHFGSNAGTAVSVTTSTSLTVTAPAGSGTVAVTVTNGDGTSTVNGSYTYAPVPAISALNPATGTTAGGTTVTITGLNLTGATAVAFGGVPGTAVTPVNATTVTVVSPAHVAGVVGVTVTTPGGTSGTFNYTYTAAAPVVSSVTPASGSVLGGTLITITGSGFTGASAVTIGGTAATNVSVTSDTTITAVTPAHAAGLANIVVVAPGGTGTGTNMYTYVTLVSPLILSVSPNSGTTLGGTSITITGSSFTGTTGVTIGGAAATSFSVASDTTIIATTPAHTAGLANIVVVTPGGTGTGANIYTYVALTLPVVTSISPATGPVAGGTAITITGSGFTGATLVMVGPNPATTFTILSDTTITAWIPTGSAGVVDVLVTTPAGTSMATPADEFIYTPTGLPVVTAVTPTSGPTTGGTYVTVSGMGFSSAIGVTFGGIAATNMQVLSDTSITAQSPANPAGVVDVIVTNANGSSTANTADQFTYGSGPIITGISPASGNVGTVITITGTGFTGATSVTFDTTPATPTSVTDTQIIVTAPSHTSGSAAVSVVTPVGVSSAATFTFAATTTSYTLNFRWSLIVWNGKDGISVSAALAGQESPDNPATNDISSQVTAMFRWNGSAQRWEAYFPGQESVPGAVDFTTLTQDSAYWIAITGPNAITWTVGQG